MDILRRLFAVARKPIQLNKQSSVCFAWHSFFCTPCQPNNFGLPICHYDNHGWPMTIAHTNLSPNCINVRINCTSKWCSSIVLPSELSASFRTMAMVRSISSCQWCCWDVPTTTSEIECNKWNEQTCWINACIVHFVANIQQQQTLYTFQQIDIPNEIQFSDKILRSGFVFPSNQNKVSFV